MGLGRAAVVGERLDTSRSDDVGRMERAPAGVAAEDVVAAPCPVALLFTKLTLLTVTSPLFTPSPAPLPAELLPDRVVLAMSAVPEAMRMPPPVVAPPRRALLPTNVHPLRMFNEGSLMNQGMRRPRALDSSLPKRM